MCGLWGAVKGSAAVKNLDFSKFAYGASIAGTLRGSDSTGMAVIDHVSGDSVIYKRTVPGGIYANLPDAQGMFDLAGVSRLFLGHNRAATLGTVTDEAAHPFQHGNVVLAHNGTVNSFEYDLADLLVNYDAVNDSDAIAYCMDIAGWEEVLPRLTGAYALTWWDKDANRFFMARNSQRPLHVVFAPGQEMYYASEANMLRWLCERSPINVIGNNTPIHSLRPGVVYSFPLEGNPKDQMEQKEFKIAAAWGNKYYSNYNYGGNYSSKKEETKNTESSSTSGNGGRHTVSSSEKLLKEIGISRGEILGFLPEKMEYKTNKSRHGTMHGSLVKLQDDNIDLSTEHGVIHGVSPEVASEWIAEGWIEVKANGAYKDKSAVIVTFHAIRPAIGTSSKSTEKKEGVRRDYKNGKGEPITEQEFMSLVSGGCVCCRSQILLQDHDAIEWVGINKNFPVCILCAEQDWHKG